MFRTFTQNLRPDLKILVLFIFAGIMVQSKCINLYLGNLKMADRLYVMVSLLVSDWLAFRIHV